MHLPTCTHCQLPKPINNVICFSLGLLLNIYYIGQRQIFQLYHSCWYQNKGRGRDRKEYCKYFVHILFPAKLFFLKIFKMIIMFFVNLPRQLSYILLLHGWVYCHNFLLKSSVVFSMLRFLLQFVVVLTVAFSLLIFSFCLCIVSLILCSCLSVHYCTVLCHITAFWSTKDHTYNWYTIWSRCVVTMSSRFMYDVYTNDAILRMYPHHYMVHDCHALNILKIIILNLSDSSKIFISLGLY